MLTRLCITAVRELTANPLRTGLGALGIAAAITAFTLVTQLSLSARAGIDETVARVEGRAATVAVDLNAQTAGSHLLDQSADVASERLGQFATAVSELRPLGSVGVQAADDPAALPLDPPAPPPMAALYAVDPELGDVLAVRLAQGRWFAPEDEASAGVPVVVSADLAQSLDQVGTGSARGRGRPLWATTPERFGFTVVGVMEPNVLDRYADGASLLLLRPSVERLPAALAVPASTRRVLALMAADDVDRAIASVQQGTATHLELTGASDLMEVRAERVDGAGEFAAATNALALLLTAIGIVALVVGALGVANTGLMTLGQRVQEFGLLRAMGATGKDIHRLVLLESIGTALIGGVAGLACAVMIAWLLGSAISQLLAGAVIEPVSFRAAVLGLVVAAAAGLLAGLAPARRARRLSVLDALR